MTEEIVADTPVLGTLWCPTCEPDRDPAQEILDVQMCFRHVVPTEGNYCDYTSWGQSPANNLWCNAFHRGEWPT